MTNSTYGPSSEYRQYLQSQGLPLARFLFGLTLPCSSEVGFETPAAIVSIVWHAAPNFAHILSAIQGHRSPGSCPDCHLHCARDAHARQFLGLRSGAQSRRQTSAKIADARLGMSIVKR